MWNWKFANWLDSTDTGGTITAALAHATYSNTVPVVIKDSELRIYTAGTTSISGTEMNAAEYEITLNLSYTEHMAPGGTNNIVRYVRQRAVPFVSGAFTIPLEDLTWWDAKAAKTVYSFSLQLGSSPTATTGGGVLITAPAIQITDVQKADMNGISGVRVSWEGTIDSDITSPTANDDLHIAAFRIHLF
jgi:hypothetical protein